MSILTGSMIRQYLERLLRWDTQAFIASLGTAFALGCGLLFLQFTADYRVYFSPDNPQLQAFESLERTYTKTDNILFVLQPPDRNVFTKETLNTLQRLTENAWQIPYALRVDSITNFQHTRADGDELVVADLVEQTEHLSPNSLQRLRDIALREPALRNRLVSDDASTTGVMVTLQLPAQDYARSIPHSVEAARQLAEAVRVSHPGMTVALTGIAVFSHAEAEVSQRDMERLVPLMYIIIVIMMMVLLRSFAATLATLVVVTLSAISALGLAAWLGLTLNPTTALAPVIIITLAIADSIHILSTVMREMRAGSSRRTALETSMQANAEPVLLTSLTTIIGFLSLNFSDAPPFQELGNISATGVMFAWLYSMTTLPILVNWLSIEPGSKPVRTHDWFHHFAGIMVTYRHLMLALTTAVALSFIAFIPGIQLDDRFIQWFDDDLPFRRDTDFASENLIGLYSLEFSFDSGHVGGIQEPGFLAQLDRFGEWLKKQPEVSHVYSITDDMKRLNRSLHADDDNWYSLPESRAHTAQYLLLYEMSLPYGLDINSQVDVDKSATRLTVTLHTVPMKGIRAITDRSQKWLRDNLDDAFHVDATGLTIVFVYLAERNIHSMLGGTVLAFVLISITLMVVLRSVRLGLVSLIPNLLPVLMTFGLWSLLFGQIGIIASIIAATTMGLIVDDTVHILSQYERVRNLHGMSVKRAMQYSYSHVGTALWLTTLILIAGFMVLMLSSFKLNKDMGLLTSITLLFALLMDFIMLPPLLSLTDRSRGNHGRAHAHDIDRPMA